MNDHQPWIKPGDPFRKTLLEHRPSRRVTIAVAGILAVILCIWIIGLIDSANQSEAENAPPAAAVQKCGLSLIPGSGYHNPQNNDIYLQDFDVWVQVWTATNGQYVAYSPFPHPRGTVWCPGETADFFGLPAWRAWDGVQPSWCDATYEPMADGFRQCEAAITP